ncbi:OHCU decarboxylase [Nesidiocoris tenuis]|uniref:2-oxo-4-hydroxy-4-carboxy-5-ureidoimidazoline decarboxylase n=1 Tax=Nesidiocoris tenuis TaxID=355587 RepID=A0ABN7AK94_9HEMI|nr:OHCU decarboxylase [Nesidiocoris tenuis]
MDVNEINACDQDSFVKLFSNVFEHHPEAAEYVYDKRPFSDRSHLLKMFFHYMETLPLEVKKQVLINHPMLGSKKPMTNESKNEQTSAGLNQLTNSEEEVMDVYNKRYYEKFGFPYIICVKENSKDRILSDIKKRYENDMETEISTGINEVSKIAMYRILDIVK